MLTFEMASYYLDPERKLVVIHPTATSRPQDIATVFDDVLRDSRFDTTFQFISDRRGLEQEPSSEYVRDAVDVIRRYTQAFGARKWAVLIDPDKPAMFGMGRVAEAFSEHAGVSLRLFTDCSAAVEWLNA